MNPQHPEPRKRKFSFDNPSNRELLEDEEAMTERKAINLLTNLQKAVDLNQKMRIKYAENPRNFMESEAELAAEISNMRQLAAFPLLYPVLLKDSSGSMTHNTSTKGFIPVLLTLLVHENVDIVVDSLELVRELTDEQEDIDETNKQVETIMLKFVESMVEFEIISVLASNLFRFDESNPDEIRGVFSCLAVIENMLSIKPELVSNFGIAADSKIPEWLMRRISAPNNLQEEEFDGNKLYSSEILAILLQSSSENCQLVLKHGCMRHLLESLSNHMKDSHSKNAEETEFIENLFDCLCALLSKSEGNQGRKAFVDGKGVELMCSLLKQKSVLPKSRAFKTLSYSLSGFIADNNSANSMRTQICQIIVDTSSLKYIFSFAAHRLLMGRQEKTPTNEFEYFFTILMGLSVGLNDTEPECRLSKFTAKFEENSFTRAGQLVDLFQERASKFSHWTEITLESMQREYEDSIMDDQERQALFYIECLENGGLHLLQLIALTISQMILNGSLLIGCKNVSKFLKEQISGGIREFMIEILEEYASNIKSGSDEADLLEKAHVSKLLKAL